MKIAGSTFFVTGGGSGLGAACAAFRGSGRQCADRRRAGRSRPGTGQRAGRASPFARTDVTDEASVQNALAVAKQHFGGVQVVINCAGIIGVGRVVGKEGPYDLASFSRTIQVNLIGTFNVIRLAAAMMAQQRARRRARTGRDHQHRLGGGLRRPDRAGRLFGLQGGRRVDDPAHRPRIGPLRHSRGDDCAGRIRNRDDGGHDHSRLKRRWPRRCPFRRGWAGPANLPIWPQQIVENSMLNGTTIRLDGALRLSPK